MNPPSSSRALALIALLSSTALLHAQDGTWSLNGNSTWSTAGNWSSSIIADGTDATAYFTMEFTGNRTVTLDSARTIGGITYTDTTPTHNLTISGGNILTLDTTSGSPTIDVTQAGRTLTISSIIAGNDGMTKAGDGMLILTANNTWTGNTVISGGTVRFGSGWGNTWTGFSLDSTSNLELNNGIVEAYYYLTRDLGTGVGEIQITGGRAGFSNMQGDATGNAFIKFTDNSTVVTWGSATFNPSTLVLNDAGAATTLRTQNPFDLNGANRTVEVSATGRGADSGTYATMEGVLSGAGGALTKTGGGTLMLNATNTYDGGTTINQGSLWFDQTDSMPTTGNVTVNDGGILSVSVGGGGQWTTSTSGVGTIGGLLAGDGGQTASQVTYSGNVMIGLNVTGSQTYSGVIADVTGSTSTGIHVGNKDGGAGSDPFKRTGTLTLNNANTYTGETHVNRNNVLILSHANAIAGSSGLFVNDGGKVQLTTTVSLKNLTFSGTTNTTDAVTGGILAFQAGGVITATDNRYNQTITSGITGAPDVHTTDFGATNQYEGLIFAPDTNTQTLGVITNPTNTGNTDKAGVTFGGSISGNSIASISYAGGDKYGDVNFISGGWTVGGNITTGTVKVSGGEHTFSGTVKNDYNEMRIYGGTVRGNFTILTNSGAGSPYVNNGATIAPGNSIGTITIDWNATTTIAETTSVGANVDATPNGNYSFTMMDGSIYEWEIGAGNTSDVIHMVEGGLFLNDFTLKIIDLGATTLASDQLTVFTYGGSVAVDMTGFTNSFDTSTLDAGAWDFSSLSLVDNGSGTIYLTGLASIPEPSAALLGLLGALCLVIRRKR